MDMLAQPRSKNSTETCQFLLLLEREVEKSGSIAAAWMIFCPC